MKIAKLLFACFLALNLDLWAAPFEREWTILIYAGGDELEVALPTRLALKRLERVRLLGQGQAVSVILQLDDVKLEDKKQVNEPNYRYEMKFQPKPSKGSALDTPPLTEKQVRAAGPEFANFTYGERNSGDVRTLMDFVEWGVEAYPARHYALVLMGHSWGQRGVIQDFFAHGQELETATMIPNYLLGEGLQEVLTKKKNRIKRGKLDALIVDACIAGHLEVLLEAAPISDYFVASAIETPLNSIPYDEFLGNFLFQAEQSSGAPEAEAKSMFENHFLRPMVRRYAESHAPGGKLANVERQADPVELFVIRNEKVPALQAAFGAWAAQLRRILKDSWEGGSARWLSRFADSDKNADVRAILEESPRHRLLWSDEKYRESAAALEAVLGGPKQDPSAQPTTLVHERADAAKVKVDVDAHVFSRELAACLALKSYVMANIANEKLPKPEFTEVKEIDPGKRKTRRQAQHIESRLENKKVDIRYIFCADVAVEWKEHHHEEEQVPEFSKEVPITGFFGIDVKWPEDKPLMMKEIAAANGKSVAKRELSMWFPLEKEKPLEVNFRFAASQGVEIEYFAGPKKVGSQSEKFSPNVIWDKESDWGKDTLYVAESHSNGTHFKRGIGVYLSKRIPHTQDYQNGFLPWREAGKKREFLSLREYLNWLDAQGGATEEWKVYGEDFYRIHRIGETSWPDFLF